MKTFFACFLICLTAFAQPPIPKLPAVTKAQSPKAASDPINAPMAKVVPAVVTSNLPAIFYTNSGTISARFEASQIENMTASFFYSTNLKSWTLLYGTVYPMSGGTVSAPYLFMNTPKVFFRAGVGFQ